MEIVQTPQRPVSPDYDKIIQEELEKIGDFSWRKNPKERKKLQREWVPYKNPVHNAAKVDSFSATVLLKIEEAYTHYLSELDEYEIALNQYCEELQKTVEEKEKKLEETKTEFATVKTFYNNFQDLVNRKFQYISKIIKKYFNIESSEGSGPDEQIPKND